MQLKKESRLTALADKFSPEEEQEKQTKKFFIVMEELTEEQKHVLLEDCLFLFCLALIKKHVSCEKLFKCLNTE